MYPCTKCFNWYMCAKFTVFRFTSILHAYSLRPCNKKIQLYENFLQRNKYQKLQNLLIALTVTRSWGNLRETSVDELLMYIYMYKKNDWYVLLTFSRWVSDPFA